MIVCYVPRLPGPAAAMIDINGRLFPGILRFRSGEWLLYLRDPYAPPTGFRTSAEALSRIRIEDGVIPLT